MALVVGSIYFTLFIKGLTIGKLIKKLNISKVGTFEKLEYLEGKAFLYRSLVLALKEEYGNGDMTERDYEKRLTSAEKKYILAKEKVKKYAASHRNFVKRSMSKYAIGIEKKVLADIYTNNEITERGYKKFLNKLEFQETMLNNGECEIHAFDTITSIGFIDKALEKIDKIFNGKDEIFTNIDKYHYYKSLQETSKEVVKSLKNFCDTKGILDKDKEVLGLIKKYNIFYKNSSKKLKNLVENNKDLKQQNKKYVEDKILFLEKKALVCISENQLVTDKVEKILEEEINNKKFQ